MKKSKTILAKLLFLSTLNLPLSIAFAQGTAFTYQGRLNANGAPANGLYDFNFGLFSTSGGGSALGSLDFFFGVPVTNGLFTVTLDFGTNFPGAARWLEIAVRTNATATYTTLAARQPITPAPYAITAGSLVGNGLAAGVYSSAVTFNNPANSFVGDGTGLANVNAATFGGLTSSNFWQVGGNTGTSGGFIGTIDNQPFDLRVNNVRAMRYRLNTGTSGYTNAPNVIGGSSVNTVSSGVVGATIGGGGGNEIHGASVANQVNADFATVGGGQNNTASGDYATVGGGYGDTASGAYATVAGGDQNIASGDYGTVPGGAYNTAGGNWSFAAGYQAHAGHQGAFVWADFSPNLTFSSTTANQFRVRATGGAAFATAIDYTDGSVTAGVHVVGGGTSWSSISDRNAKKNFSPVNAEAVLERLVAMPVQSWNYKWESDTNTPHIGPMAQDFKPAFYPGRDDKSISTLEFDGVELAAIQGLNQKLEAKESEIQQLKKSMAELKALVLDLTQSRLK
jgi:Chaperone of endosialidase